jgi:hypothetical protein
MKSIVGPHGPHGPHKNRKLARSGERLQTNPIEAQLFGSTECRWRSIITRGQAPVLAMCRALIGAGFNPSRPLHVYRGNVLALKVRSIGEGARLTVTDAHGRPRLRRMPPQEWARLQEAQGRDFAASLA